jgi:hypothetical protein
MFITSNGDHEGLGQANLNNNNKGDNILTLKLLVCANLLEHQIMEQCKFITTRNFDAAARRAPCLNLLALVVSGNYLLLYLLKICGVVHFIWYGPMERSVACLQNFLE